MATKSWAVGLVIFSTLLTSSAQLFLKFGTRSLDNNLVSILTNYSMIMGFLLYGIAGILTIIAFRQGEVTVLYPIFATSYIWVAISSYYLLGEKLNTFKWLGVVWIVVGVSLLGISSRKKTRSASV